MVIGFCGVLEVLMLWMNANDGGPLEEAIYFSNLTQGCFYMILTCSAVKGLTGFYLHRVFRDEYHMLHNYAASNSDFTNDDYWVDNAVNNNQAQFNNMQDEENQNRQFEEANGPPAQS